MNHSRRLVLCGLTFLMFAALALPGSLRAQGNFVYTNDDIAGPNTVSGFSVAANGALTLVPGSPFLTGGTGAGGGYFASNRAAVHTDGNFLYASNTASADVSVFTINRKTGALTLVAGSPFATGGTGGLGISLAAAPDGKFLMAANGGSGNIAVFQVAGSGVLTPIAGSPFAALEPMPRAIKVSPNGKFLAVAGGIDANQVEMFSIASGGSLTSLGTFPGEASGSGIGVEAMDIDCSGRLLYAGVVATMTTVDGYLISHKGALSSLPGAPFQPGVGLNSCVALLGYGLGRKTLFVSNQGSATITVFSVAPNGSLSLLHGSPFPMNLGAFFPAGMATSQDGRLLYVANDSAKVSVFRVSGWGALTEVAGSPFATGQAAGLSSLTAFPPRRLSLFEALLDGCPVGAHSGLSSPEE